MVPENYGVSEEALLRQRRYEATMIEIRHRLIIVGLIMASALPIATLAGSAAIETYCQADELPAVVCEANQNAQERFVDLSRWILGRS